MVTLSKERRPGPRAVGKLASYTTCSYSYLAPVCPVMKMHSLKKTTKKFTILIFIHKYVYKIVY